jgi:EmrB/QacA subfamily drug resistance transporter
MSMSMTTRTQKTWTLALTSIGAFMVALDGLVVTTALTRIRADLGASLAELEWTINAYALSFAVLLMAGAAIGDRVGRRRMFVAGLGLFAAASAACALAPTMGWLIAARTVQGAGAALVMPLAMALLSAAFAPEERARALGIFSGLTGLAVLAGPVVGGAIAQSLAWEWIFWLNVPIGVVAIVLVPRRIEESVGARTAIDVRGVALVTGAALGVVWGVVRGNSAGWASAEVLGSLCAGALLTVAFVAWELRAREPMLPMRFFRSRAFASGNAAGFFLYGSLYGAVFFVAQFLQIGQGYGVLSTGLRMLPWTGPLFLVAPIAGARINRVGERPFLVGGLVLQAIGMAWIALIAEPGLAYSELVAPMVIAGAGVSMAMPAAQSSVMRAVARDEVGKGAGVFNMLRFLGGAFAIAIVAAVFAGAGSYASAQAFNDGFAAAIGVCAGLSLAGAVVGLGLPGLRRVPRVAAPAPAR